MIKIQASSVHRIIQCPKSAILETKVPYELQVKYAPDAANTGRKYHAAAERVLKGSTVLAALKVEGIERGTEDWLNGKHTVEYYTKYVKKLARGSILSVENKLEAIIDDYRFVAKYDAVVWDEDKNTLHVFDLKTGNMDYSGSAFDQLIFTTWLLIFTTWLLTFIDVFYWPDIKYKLHIVQPNYYDEAQRVVCQSGFITQEQAKQQLEYLMHRVEEYEDYHPGDHCTFCPALPICPAYHNNEVINMATDIIKIENIPDEQLERIVLRKKELEKFLSACEEYAKNKLEKGHTFNSIQLVTSRGKRKWIDEEKATDYLVTNYPYDELFDIKLLSPACIEKMFGKDAIEGLTEQATYTRIAVKENMFEVIE